MTSVKFIRDIYGNWTLRATRGGTTISAPLKGGDEFAWNADMVLGPVEGQAMTTEQRDEDKE